MVKGSLVVVVGGDVSHFTPEVKAVSEGPGSGVAETLGDESPDVDGVT